MELTVQQIEAIEELSGMNWVPEDIAMYLDIPAETFMQEFHNLDSRLRYHYDRGRLITQAKVDRDNLRRAQDGNLTSLQMVKKDMYHRSIENMKKQLQVDQGRECLDKAKTEYARLQEYVERGQINDLPQDMVVYYEQLDYIRSLYNKWNSRNYIIKMVCLKWPDINMIQAGKLYCDTLNFFYLDNQVKLETWGNVYAEKLEQLASLAFTLNDIKESKSCIVEAARLRGVGKDKPADLPSELYDRRPVINIIDPRMFGITSINRRKLAEFLDGLDITENEKVLLRRDAGMEDTYFEIIPPESHAESQDQE